MIDEILIKNTATYDDTGARIDRLKKINFFFGANGSGKTTISRVIGHDGDGTYPDCKINWRDGVLNTLVYNQDFVKENFRPSENLKGIFTLGKVEADTQEKIAKIGKLLDAIDGELKSHDENKGIKSEELKDLHNTFKEDCWDNIYKYYQTEFGEVFSGLGKKETFLERVLEEHKKHYQPGHKQTAAALDELKERARTVFAKNAEKASEINVLEQSLAEKLEELTNNPILQKKIVNNGDTEAGKIIKKLDNSDWVSEGLKEYVPHSEGACPFCQQKVNEALLAKLQACFDEEYENNRGELQRIQEAYKDSYEVVMNSIQGAINAPESFIDQKEFSNLKDKSKNILSQNITQIEKKIKEPSISLSLESVSEILREITAFLTKINGKIQEHNRLIDNKKIEKQKLIADIWAFLVTEKDKSIIAYQKQRQILDTEIKDIQTDIDIKNKVKKAKEEELKKLQSSLKGVQKTVNDINSILKQFGFTNFSLATCGEKNESYKIIRPDGSDVEETLSEGERSFVTFLYFYHLIKGNHSADSDAKAEIIVFDDPVSSLDSNVLFIVSQIIRDMITENKLKDANSNGLIKQIFILTHNVYFHKQISNELKGEICFYHVYKNTEHTVIECKDEKNTITSSYECLWSELRYLKETGDRQAFALIQNVMRRILEYYFEDLQGKKKEKLTKDFSEEEKHNHAAFLQWLHAGSHRMPDEDYYNGEGDIDNFLQCFKLIFEKNGQKEHYHKMINS